MTVETDKITPRVTFAAVAWPGDFRFEKSSSVAGGPSTWLRSLTPTDLPEKPLTLRWLHTNSVSKSHGYNNCQLENYFAFVRK